MLNSDIATELGSMLAQLDLNDTYEITIHARPDHRNQPASIDLCTTEDKPEQRDIPMSMGKLLALIGSVVDEDLRFISRLSRYERILAYRMLSQLHSWRESLHVHVII